MNLLFEVRNLVYKETKKETADSFFEEFDNKILNQLKIMCYKIFKDNKKLYLDVGKLIDDTMKKNKISNPDITRMKSMAAFGLTALKANLKNLNFLTGLEKSSPAPQFRLGSPDTATRRTALRSSRMVDYGSHEVKYTSLDDGGRASKNLIPGIKKSMEGLQAKSFRGNQRKNLLAENLKNLKNLNLRTKKQPKSTRNGSNLPKKLRIEGNSGSKKNRAQSPTAKNLLKKGALSNENRMINSKNLNNGNPGLNFRNKRANSGHSPDGGSFILSNRARQNILQNDALGNKDSFLSAAGTALPFRVSSASTNFLRMVPNKPNVKVARKGGPSIKPGQIGAIDAQGALPRTSGMTDNSYGLIKLGDVQVNQKKDDSPHLWKLGKQEPIQHLGNGGKESRTLMNPTATTSRKISDHGVTSPGNETSRSNGIGKPIPVSLPMENRVTSRDNKISNLSPREFVTKKLETFEITGAEENPELRMVSVSITDCDSPERPSLQSNLQDFESPKVSTELLLLITDFLLSLSMN